MNNAPDALSSIPRLLARNVREFGAKPAYREKEFGIWQSWTWAQAAEEIEALALGFLTLGIAPGDHVAIVGRNRPRLYMTMVAAQSAGAVPVPVYQDSVAEEIRMQVLQRIDIFTDTRLRKQLSAQLQPIVDRAAVQMVGTINEEVGKSTGALWGRVWQPPMCLKDGSRVLMRYQPTAAIAPGATPTPAQ